VSLFVRPSGERAWHRIEYWPCHDGSGRLLGVFGMVRPASETPAAPDSPSQRIRAELLAVRDLMKLRHGHDALIGQGPRHERLLEQIAAAATITSPVMISGDPGTGRRFVASLIHARSASHSAAMIILDLQVLDFDAIEREVIGADAENQGIFGLPPGSLAVLHEIGELPRDLQAQLEMRLDDSSVRVIATTSRDPDELLSEAILRESLFYKLSALVIRLAPLRARLSDLPLLAQHLVEKHNRGRSRARLGLSQETFDTLAAYDWPGNVAELERVLARAHERAQSDLIEPTDLPGEIRGVTGSAYASPPRPVIQTSLDETLTSVEKRMIEQALRQSRHNKSKAAELLKISRPRLYRRIEELGIPDVPEAVEPAAAPAARNG
jgi:DNA-binding NtrC family response regulator